MRVSRTLCYNRLRISTRIGVDFLYKYFLPDEYVKDIFQIKPEVLKEKGIKGIITDLDNTLVEWDRPEATPAIIDWMKAMKTLVFK